MARPEHSTIAKSANIKSTVDVEHPIHVGPRVEFHSGSIGRYSFINIGTVIFNDVHIGRFSTFARDCQLGGSEHPIHHLTTSFFGISDQWFPDDPIANATPKRRLTSHPLRKRPHLINIGSDVWVGARATILKGVTIGNGAVVGAGSVVTKDVPDYAIVAGNPAKVIRLRFDEPTIARLLSSKWWDLEPEIIARLPLGDVEMSLRRIEEIRALNSRSLPTAAHLAAARGA